MTTYDWTTMYGINEDIRRTTVERCGTRTTQNIVGWVGMVAAGWLVSSRDTDHHASREQRDDLLADQTNEARSKLNLQLH